MNRAFIAAVVAVSFSAASAWAAMPTGVSVSADKRFTMHAPGHSGLTPTFFHPGTKTTFFSNLGTKYPKGVYYPWYSYTISGANSVLGFAVTPAVAFTPSVSGTVTEVAVGAGYEDGTNALALQLTADNNNQPGTVLKSWKETNIIQSPGCCQLTVGKDKAGVPVKAGTQYWIVLGPTKQNATTFAVWNTNTTDEVDNVTVGDFQNGAWSVFSTQFVPAVGVYGD